MVEASVTLGARTISAKAQMNQLMDGETIAANLPLRNAPPGKGNCQSVTHFMSCFYPEPAEVSSRFIMFYRPITVVNPGFFVSKKSLAPN